MQGWQRLARAKSKVGFTGIEVLLVLAVLGVVGGGTAVAADRARPGDFLFPLDQTLEGISLSLTRDPVKRQERRVELVKERLGEVKGLRKQLGQNAKRVRAGLTVATQKVTETAEHIGEVEEAAERQRASQALSRVQATLQNLSQLTGEQMQQVEKIKLEAKDNEVRAELETISGQVAKVEREIKEGQSRLKVKLKQKIESEGEDEDEVEVGLEPTEIEAEDEDEPDPTHTPKLTKAPEPTETPEPTEASKPTEEPEARQSETFEVE